jgi:23S rRNA (pseudouridine1915-N3)-methyltransferase
MKFTLYNIGKTEVPYLQQGIDEYLGRINHFINFSIIDLPQVRHGKGLSPEILSIKEGEILAKALANNDVIILLDEKGKEYTSRAFSGYLAGIMNQGVKHVAFVTGGAYGFSVEIRKLAHHSMSLSRMTFTHQLVRLIFAEQLYRALTLIKGIPYHND